MLAEDGVDPEAFGFVFRWDLLMLFGLEILVDFLPELFHTGSTLGDAAHEGRTDLHIG